MKKWSLGIVLLLLLPCAATGNSSRPIVFNEVLATVPGVETAFPLYLSRFGTYYAELYLEDQNGVANTPSDPLALSLTLTFRRRDEVVLARELNVQFAAGETSRTILFLESPFDLPQRKRLEMGVEFHPAEHAAGMALPPVRMQLTRKLQIHPFRH